MITEIAQIDVKPGTEKDFEAAVAQARPIFLRLKGARGFELHKSIEKPQRYRFIAKWETLENHTVDFRGSEDFTAWRALVGPYFAAPPEVEHTETVLTSAG
jgi:quinol monooxygenase YgiN